MAKKSKVNFIPADILHDVVKILEEVLNEQHKTLTPANKAEITVLLCEEICEQEEKERKGKKNAKRKSATKKLVDQALKL